MTAAGNTGDTENFSAVSGEGNIVKLDNAVNIADGEVFNYEPRFGVDRLRAGNVKRDGMPDHHVGHLLGVGCLCGSVSDKLSAAEDGYAVRQLLNLVKLMGDDDDCLAVCAHIAQNCEELVGFLRGENGGRLVKNKDVRSAVQRLDDLHSLLLRNGHIVYLLLRVDIKAVLVAYLLNACADLLEVKPAFSGQTENDVLRGCENIHQLEMLVDHANTKVKGILGTADGNLAAVYKNVTAVRIVDA